MESLACVDEKSYVCKLDMLYTMSFMCKFVKLFVIQIIRIGV